MFAFEFSRVKLRVEAAVVINQQDGLGNRIPNDIRVSSGNIETPIRIAHPPVKTKAADLGLVINRTQMREQDFLPKWNPL